MPPGFDHIPTPPSAKNDALPERSIARPRRRRPRPKDRNLLLLLFQKADEKMAEPSRAAGSVGSVSPKMIPKETDRPQRKLQDPN